MLKHTQTTSSMHPRYKNKGLANTFSYDIQYSSVNVFSLKKINGNAIHYVRKTGIPKGLQQNELKILILLQSLIEFSFSGGTSEDPSWP